MPLKALDPHRVMFNEPLSPAELRALAANREIATLQCSTPQSDKTWTLLNSVFFAERPDVTLRLFGFYGLECDLSFLPRLPNVQAFSADAIMQATGVAHIASLNALHSLAIGIYSLDSFAFLADIPQTLRSLHLLATRSKKPDLAPLSRFQALSQLYLEAQQKNIGVLSELTSLRDLTLRSISTPDLSYVSSLSHLKSLDIKLGGIKDLSHIAGSTCIKYLELWQILGLDNIDAIGLVPSLQNLFLQSLSRIKALPHLGKARSLRRLTVQNLRALRDFSHAEFAPALEEFLLIEGLGQQPDHLLPVLRNRSLRRASAYFGSDARNDRFKQMLAERGIEGVQAIGLRLQLGGA